MGNLTKFAGGELFGACEYRFISLVFICFSTVGWEFAKLSSNLRKF
jgi:hypothetical protein